jgi:hypothetical protein
MDEGIVIEQDQSIRVFKLPGEPPIIAKLLREDDINGDKFFIVNFPLMPRMQSTKIKEAIGVSFAMYVQFTASFVTMMEEFPIRKVNVIYQAPVDPEILQLYLVNVERIRSAVRDNNAGFLQALRGSQT